METEDLFTKAFPAFSFFALLTGFLDPGFWPMLLQWIVSGNSLLESLAGAVILITVVGGIVLVYYAIIALVLVVMFAIFVLAPAYFVYLILGPTYSLILVALVCAGILLYLVETRTVRIEHHTITVALHRKYVIRR